MKAKEELCALKEEVETVKKKFAELPDEEVEMVTGGVSLDCGRSGSGGGCVPTPSAPSTPSTPSTPTESFTVPVKGEDTVHIDESLSDGKLEITESVY